MICVIRKLRFYVLYLLIYFRTYEISSIHQIKYKDLINYGHESIHKCKQEKSFSYVLFVDDGFAYFTCVAI